jgi:hypothetical protein
MVKAAWRNPRAVKVRSQLLQSARTTAGKGGCACDASAMSLKPAIGGSAVTQRATDVLLDLGVQRAPSAVRRDGRAGAKMTDTFATFAGRKLTIQQAEVRR